LATLRCTGLFGVSVLSFLLAACGSDPVAAPGTGGGTSTGPTVTSTIPASNGPGVALNVKVAATFSSAMDPSTITASSFTVRQGTANVAGTVA